jgi:hypothetical protein
LLRHVVRGPRHGDPGQVPWIHKQGRLPLRLQREGERLGVRVWRGCSKKKLPRSDSLCSGAPPRPMQQATRLGLGHLFEPRSTPHGP